MNWFSLPQTVPHELFVEYTPPSNTPSSGVDRRPEVRSREYPDSHSAPIGRSPSAPQTSRTFQQTPVAQINARQDRNFSIASEMAIEFLNQQEELSTGVAAQHDDCVYAHHDEAELDRVLKRLLGVDAIHERLLGCTAVVSNPQNHAGPPPGVSELDDAPGAILVAKPALVELQNTHGPRGNDHEARLHHFQGHELSSTPGDFALNLGLDGAMGAAGGAALFGGIMDFRESGKKAKTLEIRQKIVEEKVRAFSRFLVAQDEAKPSDSPHVEHLRLRKISMLQSDLIVLEADLQQLNQALGHCGSEKKVALGSGTAGFVSLIRAVVGFAAKPLAYYSSVTAGVSGTVLSVASVALAPLGAGAAVYFSRKARNLSEAQRQDAREKFDAAFRELGLVEGRVPKAIWEHYKRCFVDTKLLSHREKAKSFHTLLKWFVRAMWGYLGTTSGLSIAKIIALLVAGSVFADVTLSVGVLTAATAVLLTLYGFIRYQSRMNRHEFWKNSPDPSLDKDFMLSLAATGDMRGFIQANKLSILFHRKRERLYDFRHALQIKEGVGLRFDGLKMHSTDTAATQEKRKEQKAEAGKNMTQRFAATHGFSAGRKMLSTVLQSPGNFDLMANYMINDLDDDLRYLNDEIQQKIRQLDLDGKNIPFVASKTRHNANKKQAELSECVHQKKANRDSSPTILMQESISTDEECIERHFYEKGLGLLNDKVRYTQMRLLRNQLLHEKEQLTHDPARIADLQSRFLSVQQRCIHNDSSRDTGKSASQRWAQDLARNGGAEKRIRATLGRLEVLIPETAVLRQAANSTGSLLPLINVDVPGWEAFLETHKADA